MTHSPRRRSFWLWPALLVPVVLVALWSMKGAREEAPEPEQTTARPARRAEDAQAPPAPASGTLGPGSERNPGASAPREAPESPLPSSEEGAPIQESDVEVETGGTLPARELLPLVQTLRPHLERCLRDHGEPLASSEEAPLRFRMHVQSSATGTQVRALQLDGSRHSSPYAAACFEDVEEEVPLPNLAAFGESTVTSPLRPRGP